MYPDLSTLPNNIAYMNKYKCLAQLEFQRTYPVRTEHACT